MEIMKLKRRFLKDRKVASAFFAKSQSRQKTQREVYTFLQNTVYEYQTRVFLILHPTSKTVCQKGYLTMMNSITKYGST